MKNRSYRLVFRRILYLVLIFWFSISVIRLTNNCIKLYSGVFHGQNSKANIRITYFGVDQLIVENIKSLNPKNVLLLNENGTISIFYLRYMLYPIEIHNKKRFSEYDVVIVYDGLGATPVKKDLLNGYKIVKQFRDLNNREAVMYKK